MTEKVTAKQPYNWNIYYETLKPLLNTSAIIEKFYHEYFKRNHEDAVIKTKNQKLIPKEQTYYFSRIFTQNSAALEELSTLSKYKHLSTIPHIRNNL